MRASVIARARHRIAKISNGINHDSTVVVDELVTDMTDDVEVIFNQMKISLELGILILSIE
jgi:hypothetical protein